MSPGVTSGLLVCVIARLRLRSDLCIVRRMSAPTSTPLDTFARQFIQSRIDAIRANVRERDGRDLTSSEIAKLRRLLEREARGEPS